jgi:hypothetical protein
VLQWPLFVLSAFRQNCATLALKAATARQGVRQIAGMLTLYAVSIARCD